MPQVTYRANMLPYVEYDDGSAGFGAPKLANALMGFAQNAYENPYETAKALFYDPIPRSFNEANRSIAPIPEGGEYAPDNMAGFDAAALAPLGSLVTKAASPKLAADGAGALSANGTLKAAENAPAYSAKAYRGVAGDEFNYRDGRVFMSTSPEVASDYALAGGIEHLDDPARVWPTDVSFQNPMIFDAGGASYNKLPYQGEQMHIDLLTAIAKHAGHDGLVVNNVVDPVSYFAEKRPATTIAALKPGTVRSATTGELLFSNPDEAASIPLLARALEAEQPSLAINEFAPGRYNYDLNGTRLQLRNDGPDQATITQLYTVPEQRGQGQAKTLLDLITQFADESGSRLALNVDPGAQSMDYKRLEDLYRAFGFDGSGYMERAPK